MQDIQTLVRQCQDGHLDAFDALFGQFRHRVYDLAGVILRDDMAAEDVVQDTFLAVFQKIDGFKGESSFETWLIAITVNQCRMRLRRQKLRNFLSFEQLSPRRLFQLSRSQQGVPDVVASQQQRQTLWDMVDQLDERLRLPIILRYKYALPCDQIAVILDLRKSTIYQQLKEGRKHLARMRKQHAHDQQTTLAELFD